MNLSDIWGAKEDEPIVTFSSIVTEEVNQQIRADALVIHERIVQLNERLNDMTGHMAEDIASSISLTNAAYKSVCDLNFELFQENYLERKLLHQCARLVEKAELENHVQWLIERQFRRLTGKKGKKGILP